MREIKFRAWDKNKRLMVYDGDQKWMSNSYRIIVTSIGIKYCKKLDHDTSIKDENGVVGYTDWEHDGFAWENIDLMQFTGLKDKNGKEIYEGDILRCTGYKREFIITVEWENMLSYTSMGAGMSNTEVIGNIYENPELIKPGK